MEESKIHWNKIYTDKQPGEVSWTQPIPRASLYLMHELLLEKSARIIDVGGGDSKLVDFLVDEGYMDITVLDISEKALSRAKNRLGEKAALVNWVVSDIIDFNPQKNYDYWHDRATFHFLTLPAQIEKYLSIARTSVKPEGYLTIGTFSKNGPEKCSGLNIRQYSEESLSAELNNGFKKVKCINDEHITPFNTTQDFLFCSFKRIE